MNLERIRLLIGNQEIDTENYIEIKDPGRFSEVIGTVAQGNAAHVDQAVNAAHQAFQVWRKTGLQERSALLLKAADVIEHEIPGLPELLTKETGLVYPEMKLEVAIIPRLMRSAVDLAQTFLEPKQVEDAGSWNSLEKRPLGVVVIIVPWNAPLLLALQKVAPALITGNTVIVKPSPNAPLALSIILNKIAGLFPPGVINVIHGEDGVGSALSTHPLVRKISFTGGGKVAKIIMKSAADSLKNLHFELGGNDPAIVLDDADLDEAIPKIVAGSFRKTGQLCFGIKRVYVPETIFDSFCDKFCEHLDTYKVGHGLDANTDMGPLNNQLQYNFVKDLIQRTKQSGAKVVELGTKLDPDNWDNGYYLRPTVVINPDPNDEIVVTEQFGPVIPLISYRTEEEVIQMANQTEYGLCSSVWSSDFERAVRVSREIEAGTTYINEHENTRLGGTIIPFGGVKQSGIGRIGTEIGMAEFIEYHGIAFHKPRG